MEREVFEKLTKQAFIDCLSTARNIHKGLEDEATRDTIATFGLNALVPIRLKQLIREQERFAEAKRLYAKLIKLQETGELYEEGTITFNNCGHEHLEHKHVYKACIVITILCNKFEINVEDIGQFHKDSSTIKGMNKFKEIVEFMLK